MCFSYLMKTILLDFHGYFIAVKYFMKNHFIGWQTYESFMLHWFEEIFKVIEWEIHT